MDKQPVGQLPDLTQSNNDDEIMVITNDEYNQLKKEKISDFITDLTSTDENNALVKGTDGKLFTKDFGNASNITEGTLPVSVLPDIPKDKLPDIEITDLPESGVTADTYTYPSSVTVNAQGMVTAISEGSPSGANANTDLSNITDAGKEVIRENAGTVYQLFDLVVKDHILTEQESVGLALPGTYVTKAAYPDFYQACVDEKEAGTPTQTQLGDSTITTYNNANSHIFYDIADKSVVDAFYEALGIAWFYGVDTTNERIFLPRGKNYVAYGNIASTAPVVGNGMTLGLTDGTNNSGLQYYNTPYRLVPNTTGYGLPQGTTGNPDGASNGLGNTWGVTDDPTKSGVVAQTSNIINGKEGYVYIVVGNTVINSDQALIDAQGLIAEAWDEVDDKVNDGLAALAGASNALTQNQITNCLLEVPQRVKLTFDNDQGLVLHAGSEVIVPYGKGTPTMQIGDALNGGVISDVQVVGNDNKIFYYITYNSDIVLGKTIGTGGNTYWLYVTPEGTISGDVADDIYSQAAQPTGISESVIWYDTTNNYVKVTLNTGSSWTQGNSLLIGRLNRTGTGTITSVRDIYNGVGVIGSNFWVDKDVVYCTPAGRNPDGSLKNNIGRINNFTIYSSSVSGTNRFLFLNPFESQNNSANHQGVFWDIENYFISEDLLYQKRAIARGSQYGILYRPSENLFYWSSIQNPNWTVFPEGLVFLGSLGHDSTRGNDSDGYPVISFGTRQALPFKALNYYDRLYIGNLSSIGAFINVAFGASGTQYIAPFDGWFYAQKVSGISGGYIQCVNETKNFFDESKAWDSNTTLAASVPVSNGDLCTLNYTATGGRAYLRFYTINALYQ